MYRSSATSGGPRRSPTRTVRRTHRVRRGLAAPRGGRVPHSRILRRRPSGTAGSGAGPVLGRPDGRVCPPSTVFAAFHAYGGAAGVAKDIEVYTHNRHEGGVDYQVDRQLSWFAECFADGI